MRYIDGYLLTIPKSKLKIYKKMAQDGGRTWMKFGALQYVESMAEDMDSVKQWGGFPFPKAIKAKKDEVVFFSFIVYKSRKHRDAVNAKVHAQMEKDKEKYKNFEMPFDMKRMAFGGFETVVDL